MRDFSVTFPHDVTCGYRSCPTLLSFNVYRWFVPDISLYRSVVLIMYVNGLSAEYMYAIAGTSCEHWLQAAKQLWVHDVVVDDRTNHQQVHMLS